MRALQTLMLTLALAVTAALAACGDDATHIDPMTGRDDSGCYVLDRPHVCPDGAELGVIVNGLGDRTEYCRLGSTRDDPQHGLLRQFHHETGLLIAEQNFDHGLGQGIDLQFEDRGRAFQDVSCWQGNSRMWLEDIHKPVDGDDLSVLHQALCRTCP